MKKNERKNRYICLCAGMILAILCVCFAGMEAKHAMHTPDLNPASASLISPELSRSTQTSAEELTGLRQVSARLKVDQRLCQKNMTGMVSVIIVLAILLANTVFYKEKKRLLVRNDADGKRFIICYIHHQDGRRH